MNKKLCKFKEWLILKLSQSILNRYFISAILHPKNFIFCLKYPFWKSTNVWSGKFMGYNFTWYDDISEGWKIAFGKKLSEDIVKAFKEEGIPKRKWSKNLNWQQIKEKWGCLCLYASAPEKVQNVLNKYETLSCGYCMFCGKPAKYVTSGWITYVCEECMLKELERSYIDKDGNKKYWYNEEYRVKGYKNCRLTKKDIPTASVYNSQTETWDKVNYKKLYNIDFEELWGLNK